MARAKVPVKTRNVMEQHFNKWLNKVEAGRAVEGKRASAGYGTLSQRRQVDPAVKAVGGRGGELASAAKKVASGIRSGNTSGLRGAAAALRASDHGKTLLKAAMRGMLSPAALAEGVAGSAAKAATHEKVKREARAESKPTKGGMKRVKTKA